jgi:hypothetical protein
MYRNLFFSIFEVFEKVYFYGDLWVGVSNGAGKYDRLFIRSGSVGNLFTEIWSKIEPPPLLTFVFLKSSGWL